MNTIFLLSVNFIGSLCLVFLFLLSFCFVHIARLAAVGWKHTAKKTPQPPEAQKAEKKAPALKQEPIYYIVERKKHRAKSSYSEPKEIRFK